MAMPAADRRWTVAEVLALPDDGKRYELIAGELLVTPAPMPPHQRVSRRLLRLLDSYLAAHAPDTEAFYAPADISWDDETLVQPDLFVLPSSEVSRSWRTARTLLLAVEIVSPSSVRADRVLKRQLYQRHGVGEYWVVDADARCVEVWHPTDERPQVVTSKLHWRVAADAPELVIELPELFEDLPR